jgi:hypothetical protein
MKIVHTIVLIAAAWQLLKWLVQLVGGLILGPILASNERELRKYFH